MGRYSMFMDRKTRYCKMSILPNLIYGFNESPIKIPAGYLVDIKKQILKFIWRGKKKNPQKPRRLNTILKKKNKLED